MERDDTLWVLIAKDLAGACTPDERAHIDARLSDDPALQGDVALLRRAVQHVATTPDGASGWDPNVKWGAVAASLSSSLSQAGERPATRLRAPLRLAPVPARRAAWYALASFVLGIVVILVGLGVGNAPGRQRVAASGATYATANGQRANVTLPDGSTVSLNVASRLDVPADYATGNHTVRLTGEALFTVVRHQGAPFTVIAGAVPARVLGTSFVVRHYASDTTTVVAVREGKVAVRSAVVAAAQQVEVGPGGGARVRAASPSQFTFATGTLTIDGTPLASAIADLDRWYDADVRLGDTALASRHIKGEFTVGSLADLQEILELTFNARVVRDGRVLTLYPRR